jgi:hypothetical protein
VCYLQRQLITRDQRIAEQSYDIEQLRNLSVTNSISDNNAIANKKTAPIQILRTSNPDLVISTVSQISFSFFCAFYVLTAIDYMSCLAMSSFLYQVIDDSLNIILLP